MTDIAVFSYSPGNENLSWDLTPDLDAAYARTVTLDVSKFDTTQHYSGGYLKSGIVLGKVTATGLYGPYLSSANDGRQTAVGILKASVQVTQPITGAAKAKVGAAIYTAWAVVSLSALPYTSGNAALGGFVDSGAQTALSHIHFEA